METVSIALTKDQKEFVDAQMAAGRHRSVSAYLNALLRAERRRKAEEHLVALVREAEASGPATKMTKADWDRLKQQVWDRVAKAKGKGRASNRPQDRRRTGS